MGKKQKQNDWLAVGLGIGAMVTLGLWMMKHYPLMETLVSRAGVLGPIVSIGLYILLSLTPVPSDPLTMFNGLLFGWTNGLIISWFGNMAAAIVEYFLAGTMGDLTKFDLHKKKLPAWFKKFPINSPWFLILGRFIPGVGGKMVSVMAGLYKVSLITYCWTAAIANLLGSFMYLFGGAALAYIYRLY